MDVGDRLFRLLKANIEDKLDYITQIIDHGSGFLDEKLSEWEKIHGLDDDSFKSDNSRDQSYSDTRNDSSTGSRQPDQFVEDLSLFGLKPPSSLGEVKRARNQEIKKYHPDKYLNDPEKLDVAKQIMQIYNGAYERLKERFDE